MTSPATKRPMKPERDPRVDPRPGDVLRETWPNRSGYTDLTVIARHGIKDRIVEYWAQPNNMKSRTWRAAELSDWIHRAGKAVIIKEHDNG